MAELGQLQQERRSREQQELETVAKRYLTAEEPTRPSIRKPMACFQRNEEYRDRLAPKPPLPSR